MGRLKKKNPLPVGNPKSVIDWDFVDDLLIKGCNGAQIAPRLGIHQRTLYDRCFQDKGVNWAAYLQEKNEQGNSHIHEKQYEKAIIDGNVTMLIHLGKHRLNQKDSLDEQKDDNSFSNVQPLIDLLTSIQSAAQKKQGSNEGTILSETTTIHN